MYSTAFFFSSDLNYFMTSLSIKEKVEIFAICDTEKFCPGITVYKYWLSLT